MLDATHFRGLCFDSKEGSAENCWPLPTSVQVTLELGGPKRRGSQTYSSVGISLMFFSS